MKILHIQQYFNENMGYQENVLPYYQQKMGHDVVLITSTRSDGFNNETRIRDEKEFVENGFRVKRVKIKGEFRKRFVLFYDLYKHIEDERPDYIYHHSVTSPSIKTVCKYKKNNPNVFIAVDNHADLNISGRKVLWKILYYNILWKNFIAEYDKYIDIYFGVTPIRCLFLEEELGVKAEKIRLLPIGADVDNTNVKMSKSEFFKKFNIKSNRLIITHGGKITPEKQVDKVLRAFRRIENENIHFVIFGSIKDQKVETLIKSDERIVSIGWLNREDTMSILRYSDVGIWNTQHTTLLEDCIAVGLPLILRYYGSTCHLLDGTGLFLYDGSIREIQDKLQFLIENKELMQKFRDNTKYIRELLSYNNIARESVEYSKDISCKEIHKKFMSVKFADKNYRNFKII